MRIGALPATRAWQEVIRLIAENADVAVVADAAQRAAEKAFAWVLQNAGFREAMYLLTHPLAQEAAVTAIDVLTGNLV